MIAARNFMLNSMFKEQVLSEKQWYPSEALSVWRLIQWHDFPSALSRQ
jgi:hypothetical protein